MLVSSVLCKYLVPTNATLEGVRPTVAKDRFEYKVRRLSYQSCYHWY